MSVDYSSLGWHSRVSEISAKGKCNEGNERIDLKAGSVDEVSDDSTGIDWRTARSNMSE